MQRRGVSHDYGTPEWHAAQADLAKAIEAALARSKKPDTKDASDKGKGRR